MKTARGEWTGGVAKDAADMERVDAAWWAALAPAERWAVAFDLSLSFDWDGLDEDSEGLRGPAYGVRRLRG